MSSQHTPGPWQAQHRVIQDGKGGSQRYHILAGADRSIQICDMPGWDEDDTANARLIAAAPDQHNALLAIVARIRGEWDHPALIAFGPLSTNTPADCVAIATAAIAKAQ